MRPTTPIIQLAVLLLLAACATGRPAPAALGLAGDVRAPAARGGLRDPITAADIAAINAASAYDAIVKLRATFLQARGVNSLTFAARSTRPTVFVDGMETGTIFELRSIPARDIAEIRYLSSSEATLRYGDGYLAGIIHVTTKR